MGMSVSFGELNRPYVEQLLKYIIRYNVQVRGVNEFPKLLEKAISVGDYDSAMWIFEFAILSNLEKNPYRIFTIPPYAKVRRIKLYYLKGIKEVVYLNVLSAQKDAVYVLIVEYYLPDRDDVCRVGWLFYYVQGQKKYYANPLSEVEMKTIEDYFSKHPEMVISPVEEQTTPDVPELELEEEVGEEI